jgi:hypothetical protein
MRISTFVRSAKLMGALLGVVVAVGAARDARAELLAYEGFNYTPGSLLVDANGVGLNGGTGWGTNPWDSAQGANPYDLSAIQAVSLSYKDSGGRTLVTTGGKLYNTGLGVDPNTNTTVNSQPGRTFNFRRDGAALGATASTPVSTWISFMAIRFGERNGPATTPITRIGTYGRGANLSLFDSTLANEEKINMGENSNFEKQYTTGDDLMRLQRDDPTQIALWQTKFGRTSSLAQEGYDNWMIGAPRVQAGITATGSPALFNPDDPTMTPVAANIDWQTNPINARLQAYVTDTSFTAAVSLMVARIDHFGGDAPRDKVTMWMNPNMNAAPSDLSASAVLDLEALETRAETMTTPVNPPFSGTQGNLFSFDRLRLFAGNVNGESKAAEWYVDEIRVATTFGEVTPHTGGAAPVPEPGSLVLAAFAVAAARRLRRRA